MKLFAFVVFALAACSGQEDSSNPSNPSSSDSNPTESCLTSDDSDVRAKQARIAEKLFGLEPCEADNLTHYDYNNYMARPHNDTDKCDGYYGGHSGWDVQTKSVAGDKTADEEFYSLTSGEVIALYDEDRDPKDLGKIGVHNATDSTTTLYLHARDIYVSEGQTVNVGTPLGIQGNVGLVLDPSDTNTNEHVHVEVRDGESVYASCGAGATKDPNIDPIGYLYKAMQVQ
ncbi:MAG: M23 family metallopeptidase [Gemmatimonadetes bacterium]|nr:M23 family metallopeptidase [Gemmatimonadota bacterium]